MKSLKCVTAACCAFACTVILFSCKHDVTTPTRDNGPYFPKVKQIIAANCLTCHSPGGQGMPVVLTNDNNIVALAGSIKSAIIDPASPQNKRMPQGGELSDADKTIIQKWYDKGGKATD
jgi:uncharacterized membrane protein